MKQADFSRIVVTANRALYDHGDNSFTYRDNVVVQLGDGSTVQAGEAVVKFGADSKCVQSKSDNTVSCKKEGKDEHLRNAVPALNQEIDRILLKKNVRFLNKDGIITARSFVYEVAKKCCTFVGNVKIKKEKTSEKSRDVPVTIECQKAVINLDKKKARFFGGGKKQVSTVLVLNEQKLPVDKSLKDE